MPGEVPRLYIDEEEELERQQFLRDRGILPIEERQKEILNSFSDKKFAGELRNKVEKTDQELGEFYEEIYQLPEIERLKHLYQLGGKHFAVADQPNGVVFRTPAFHNRFHHSELDAELAKLAALRLGLSLEDVKVSMLAGWFHDLGHSAFSHTGDDLLVANGRPNHEERTARIIRESPEIKKFIEKFFPDQKVDDIQQKIISATEEEGMHGALQSMFDTLSYIIVDRSMVYQTKHENLAAMVLEDLVGYDEQEKKLVFKRATSVQALFELRARWMQDLCNPEKRMTDEARRQILRLAMRKKLLTAEDIETGTDDEVWHFLEMKMRNGELKEIANLWPLAYGDYNSSKADRRFYDTLEEAQGYLNRLTPKQLETAFMTPPFDYTRKKLYILTRQNGETKPETITAKKIKLQPEDSQYMVITSK